MDFVRQLVAAAVVVGGCAGWIEAVRRLVRKRPVLAYCPRRPVPWGLIDLALAAALLTAFQLARAIVLQHGYGIDLSKGREHLAAHGWALATLAEAVANLAGIATALALIGWRTRASCRDMGVSMRHVLQDFGLGLVAFVMLAPPVYAIQALLVAWFPYRHPLTTLLELAPGSLILAAVFVSAVVAAPIVEEFFYRMLWQGWLQDAGRRLEDVRQLVLGNPTSPVGSPAASPAPAGPNGPAAMGPPSRAAEALAIVASSTLFAAMHFSQGPAPIPLFVLALGLGYVYARTGRILPCIVVHILLNGCSLVNKLMELQQT